MHNQTLHCMQWQHNIYHYYGWVAHGITVMYHLTHDIHPGKYTDQYRTWPFVTPAFAEASACLFASTFYELLTHLSWFWKRCPEWSPVITSILPSSLCRAGNLGVKDKRLSPNISSLVYGHYWRRWYSHQCTWTFSQYRKLSTPLQYQDGIELTQLAQQHRYLLCEWLVWSGPDSHSQLYEPSL